MSDAFQVSLTAQTSGKMMIPQSYVPSFRDSTGDNCSAAETIDFNTIDVEYSSLQYSMMITVLLEVVGAFAFFMTAWYLVEDKAKVDQAVAGNISFQIN